MDQIKKELMGILIAIGYIRLSISGTNLKRLLVDWVDYFFL